MYSFTIAVSSLHIFHHLSMSFHHRPPSLLIPTVTKSQPQQPPSIPGSRCLGRRITSTEGSEASAWQGCPENPGYAHRQAFTPTERVEAEKVQRW